MRSGILTGFAQLVLAASAAAVAALLAQKFGRNARTDGFLAAYQVYVLLTVAAQSFRLAVTPALTRAAAAGQLGAELRGFGVAFGSVAVPVAVLVALFAAPLGRAVTGTLPHAAASEAAAALVWVVPAAFAQLFAGLCASALAALDSYGTAALGYGAGGIVGVAVFAVFANAHGIVSLAWGLAVNAVLAVGVPTAALLRRRALGGPRPARLEIGPRLWHLVQGCAVPVALQGCYLLALRFASHLGVGSVTSFSFAYLAASTLVGATAFSVGLISSAPLTRRGVDPVASARHVVHAAWVSLTIVGAVAGVFALVGGRIAGVVLGSAYTGSAGRAFGHLVAYLALWMLAWVAFAVTFPIVFVAEKRWTLVPLAALGFALCIPLGLGLRALWGLPGIAIAVGLATLVIAAGLMATLSWQTLVIAGLGLARLALAVGAAAALAFAALSIALSPVAAAALGVVVYVVVIVALRSLGLTEAWAYVRGLHQ